MAKTEDEYILRLCKVISVKDNQGGLRIKVRIPYIDKDLTDEQLPFCFPLLPKMLHVNPKKGEFVLVVLGKQGGYKGNRYFIGPVIDQDYNLYGEDSEKATSLLNAPLYTLPLPDPSTNKDTKGAIPNREDVAIRGRDNSDIILSENEIRMRTGFRINKDKDSNSTLPWVPTIQYNDMDSAVIDVKYDKQRGPDDRSYASSVNIAADRINLMSYDATNPIDLKDRDEQFNSEKLNEIMQKCHSLPYGDLLVEFMKEFVKIFQAHRHPYPMFPPTLNEKQREVLNQDMDKFLSKNIKIN